MKKEIPNRERYKERDTREREREREMNKEIPERGKLIKRY